MGFRAALARPLATGRHGKGPREFPAAALVWFAIIAAMTPLILFAVYGLSRWADHVRADELERVSRAAEVVANAVDRALQEYIETAQVLARSRTLQSADLTDFEEVARETAARIDAQFILIDARTQRQVVNTFAPPGAQLPEAVWPAGVARVEKTGTPLIGPLTEGPFSRGLRFAALAPVEIDGRVRFVLAHLPGEADLRKIVNEIPRAEGWFAGVMDGEGRIVARSSEHEKFYGKPASPDFLARMTGARGLIESTDLEGRASLTAYRRSFVSDWRVVVWVPRAVLEQPRRTALGLMASLGVLATVASVLAGWGATRCITGPMRRLAEQAASVGGGRRPPFAPSIVKEANLVGHTLAAASREIAERQAELAGYVGELKDRDEALRLALGSAFAVAFIWDVKADRARRLYSSEPALPEDAGPVTFEHMVETVHPQDRDAFRRDVRAALADPAGAYRGGYRLVRPDGEVRWMQEWGVVEPDADGRPARLVGISLDVTERERTAAALRESEERFSAAFRFAPIAMSIRRLSDGCYVDANEAMLAARGLTREEVIGRTALEVGIYPDPAAYETTWTVLREGGQLHAHEIELRNKDGSRSTLLYSTAPITIGGEPHVLTAAQDITERKRSERQVRLLLAEVSHRAKNLLGIVQAVARQTAYNADPEQFVTRLVERIQGLAASQDLLVHSGYRGIDVDDLARAQLAHFADLIGTRILLDGPPLRVNAAAAQAIGMSFHELSTNASKYGALSDANGVVTICWRLCGPKEQSVFELRWTESGGPKVVKPQRRGFGQMVTERMVRVAVGGEARLDFAEEGVRWTLRAPADGVLDAGDGNAVHRL